jgi:WD40 repeat-containing protein SMU1
LVVDSIHGLNSGKTLKVFRGHTSFVNTACVLNNGAAVASGGSDAQVRVWDSKTQQCSAKFQLPADKERMSEAAIEQVIALPDSGRLLVVNRSATLHVVTAAGEPFRKFVGDQTDDETFVCAALSPDHVFLYALTDKGVLYTFSYETGRIESKLKAHDTEAVGIAHHPHLSILATFARNDRMLKLFSPSTKE